VKCFSTEMFEKEETDVILLIEANKMHHFGKEWAG
jgi:hypothetical protein